MVASHNEDTVKFTLRRWVLGRQRGMAGTGGSRGAAELQRDVLWLVRSPLRSTGGILTPTSCSGFWLGLGAGAQRGGSQQLQSWPHGPAQRLF